MVSPPPPGRPTARPATLPTRCPEHQQRRRAFSHDIFTSHVYNVRGAYRSSFIDVRRRAFKAIDAGQYYYDQSPITVLPL